MKPLCELGCALCRARVQAAWEVGFAERVAVERRRDRRQELVRSWLGGLLCAFALYMVLAFAVPALVILLGGGPGQLEPATQGVEHD